MRTTSVLCTTVLATALGLTACSSPEAEPGGNGGTADGKGGKAQSATEHTDDVSKGVKVDSKAAALVPPAVKKTGKLVVAMDLTSPPTSFKAADNTTAIGLNPDFARLIAAKLGLKPQFKNVKFDSVIPGLQSHRYDMTISTMAPTPDRAKVLDMIDYWKNGSSVIVPYGNPDKLALKNLCGKRIAVQSGSVQELERLPKLNADTCKGKTPIQAVTLPNVQDGLTQLSSKRVDGVFYDTTSLTWAIRKNPKAFTLLKPEFNSNSVALALPKNSKLTPAVQAALQSVMDSPKYDEVLKRWGFEGMRIDKAVRSKPRL